MTAVDDQTAADGVPDSMLQSALEFAVGIAAAGSKLRPPLPFPAGLRPFLRFHKLPPKALGPVRRAVEDDEVFRQRLGSVATDELLDHAAMLWLQRPEGWHGSLLELLAIASTAGADAGSELRREQRRREAAEAAAARARVELLAAQTELDRERADRAGDAGAIAALTDEVATLRRRLDAATSAAAAADEARRAAETARDAAQADVRATTDALRRSEQQRSVELPDLLERARTAATDLAGLLADAHVVAAPRPAPAPRRRRAPAPHGRVPLKLPGGVREGTAEATEHLMRSGAVVLVDGYNVAKLAWPSFDLEHQRSACIDLAEDVARRWGTAITIVFDGADVPGASAPRKRLVRVSYSPAGVLADDVLREEVDRLDVERAVIVVTNDQAVVTDVRAAGASVVSSDQFIQVARR